MKDSLGDRMKAYEETAKRRLIGRMPVIVRLDGKGFSKYTRPLKNKAETTPFNEEMHWLMCNTMSYLAKNIQNVVFGYTQSDEISILLTDWKELNTTQYFGGNQSKIETVAASMATGIFNYDKTTFAKLQQVKEQFAMFDARAFNIPREDVVNYFVWRQKDAIRNSVNMLGQHHISHKQLQKKTVSQVKAEMYKMDIDWHQLDTWQQRGACFNTGMDECEFALDRSPPVFTENREYIGRYLV